MLLLLNSIVRADEINLKAALSWLLRPLKFKCYRCLPRRSSASRRTRWMLKLGSRMPYVRSLLSSS